MNNSLWLIFVMANLGSLFLHAQMHRHTHKHTSEMSKMHCDPHNILSSTSCTPARLVSLNNVTLAVSSLTPRPIQGSTTRVLLLSLPFHNHAGTSWHMLCASPTSYIHIKHTVNKGSPHVQAFLRKQYEKPRHYPSPTPKPPV